MPAAAILAVASLRNEKLPSGVMDLLHERGRITLSAGFGGCNVLLQQIQQWLVDLVVACVANMMACVFSVQSVAWAPCTHTLM